jgi:hypothetical protein
MKSRREVSRELAAGRSVRCVRCFLARGDGEWRADSKTLKSVCNKGIRMPKKDPLPRRTFLKQAAGALGAASQMGAWPALGESSPSETAVGPAAALKDAAFPRIFTGRKLKMIAFPLGGVAAGSVALGGRGQLRDWEIFNRPNKGYSPAYAFPSIWTQPRSRAPIRWRTLHSRTDRCRSRWSWRRSRHSSRMMQMTPGCRWPFCDTG